ncbi:MAG: hypothetical protein OXC93_12295, partial [Rhodospirillaceae bacterium]|nr:hypothetical protein [Rhodospirillaceae bacterium]
VFADGGTRGSTRRDRLKERTLPDLLEIVAKSEGRGAALRPEGRCRRLAGDVERSPERSLARVQRAACRSLMRRVARGTRA